MSGIFNSGIFNNAAFNVGTGVPVVVSAPEITGRGSWNLDKRKRKKPKGLRYSDFETREQIAEALKAQIAPKTIFIEPKSPIEETDDDALILAAFSRLLH